MIRNKIVLLPAILLFFLGFVSCQSVGGTQAEADIITKPKNIIYLISDGMGYNQLQATNFFEYGSGDAQTYQQHDWIHLPVSTHNLITSISEGDTTYANGYNPRRAWSDARYLSIDYTGSAEAATAMSTGRKTYATSIGLGPVGDTLVHISQAAKAMGKSIGVVTSVPFSHATPAGFAAHVNSRHSYGSIAKYMLFNTRLDLIMGAGHPDYNDNGMPQERNARYIHSAELWNQLQENDERTSFEVDGQQYNVQDVDGDGIGDPWTLIQTREEFIAMATGKTPKRVLGIPMAYSTLHYGRDMAENETMPYTKAFNENVPTLEQMTQAALNMLGQNKNGFFVMIEGGAVDWAGHDNRLGRMIEEQIDFNNSVNAAIQWVEKYSSWDETLIIVTADHETGYLTGPAHPEPINQEVVNQGKGNLPQAKWNSDSHTNSLVPLYAKGPGSDILKILANERDPVRGLYLQNTDIPNAVFIMWGKPAKGTNWHN